MLYTPAKASDSRKWLMILPTVILVVGFFLPWVNWETTAISGADMPKGAFFSISEEKFKLANPFPQTNAALALLWLVPVFAIVTLVLTFANKKNAGVANIAGFLALSLATVYVLYTNVLNDLGVPHSYAIGFYLTIVGAAGIILASSQGWLKKIFWILIGPAIVYVGFTFARNYLENEKFGDTSNTSSDFTVNANDLLKEFQANDSLANAKYREKILTVNGNISALETPNDSTVNIKFSDSTGSYAIFPFHGEEVNEVKKLKEGDAVSVKGSCSGGILSEILGTESITFKRCVLNKK